MLSYCIGSNSFYPGQDVISLVYHPPEIVPGTPATIVRPWYGSLYVVQTPNGEIHRWFAWFELAPANQPPMGGGLAVGSYATVISNVGHGNPPHIPLGTVVRIVRCLSPVIFYDVMLKGTEYHRWLAEFELAAPV